MDKMVYCNDVMARMEELFFHELSDCAGWKTEFIGVDFIQAVQDSFTACLHAKILFAIAVFRVDQLAISKVGKSNRIGMASRNQYKMVDFT